MHQADLSAVLRPHLDRLYRLAFRLTGARADAEDLVQDVLVKVCARAEELTSIRDLSPWLGRVLYNQFTSEYVKAQASCIAYAKAIDKKHSKYREVRKRLKRLKKLIQDEIEEKKEREAEEAARKAEAAKNASKCKPACADGQACGPDGKCVPKK